VWVYVKDKVYAPKVTGVEDPKTRIRDVITTVTRNMLVTVNLLMKSSEIQTPRSLIVSA
jgi:hypothetical protein